MRKRIFAFTILLFLLICNIVSVYSPPLIDVEMETNKQAYDVGDFVQITGNVTVDGLPVTDALVAVEVLDPDNDPAVPYVLRTVQTGEISNGYWKVQILDLYTCDSQGTPKTLFTKGSTAYIFICIKNIDTLLTYHVKIAFYLQYSDNSRFKAYYSSEINIEAGQEMNFTTSLAIPTSAIPGETLIFASLFSDTPANGGTAYCPENRTSFYIDSIAPSAPPQPQYFNITFKLPRTNVKLGNYTITARSMYQNTLATEIQSFRVVLLGDLVVDGKIDMRDIGAICNLYGTKEGDLGWNPDADVYKDGVINMRDIGIVCNNFGKTAIY